MDSSVSKSQPVSIRRSLVVLLVARVIIDTGYRAVYPFLPFIATDLNVSVESAAQIIQFRNLTGLLSPLFGPLSDRYGRRVMMLAGLAIVAITGIGLYFVTSLWVAVIVITLMGLSTILFVPAQQAFLGDNVPYAQRGRAMALAEIAWSLAAIVGLPLVGILVETRGWRAGFVAIGVFAILAMLLLWFALPHEKRNAYHATCAIGGAYRQAVRAPMALAVIATISLLAVANEMINITFGAWMNQSFGVDAVGLGFVAAAIGGAELVSELFAAAFVDRVGKWRMVGGSLVMSIIAYLALPFIGVSALWGTVGLVAAFFMFELAIVSALPLVTEIAPDVRATLLSLSVAGFSLGRAAGSFLGPALFSNYGIMVTSFASAAAILVGSVIWFMFVHEKHAEVVAT